MNSLVCIGFFFIDKNKLKVKNVFVYRLSANNMKESETL